MEVAHQEAVVLVAGRGHSELSTEVAEHLEGPAR